MQSTRIPISICTEIDRIQRDFIWGHPEGGIKMHSVSCDMMCKSKGEGGLGIKKLTNMNDAFFMKLGWKFKVNLDNICSQVLIGKYGRGKDLRREISVSSGDLCIWKEIGRL